MKRIFVCYVYILKHTILQCNEVSASWILAENFCEIYVSVCIITVYYKHKLAEKYHKETTMLFV